MTKRDVNRQMINQKTLPDAEQLARLILNSLPAHYAIVDQNGTIRAVNQAWRDFAKSNGGAERNTNEGVNYLSVCDDAMGPGSEEGKAFANGIRAVLNGQVDRFELEYPCHAKNVRRWFIGRVTRFPLDGQPRVAIAHEDISDRKAWEEALGRANSRLTSLLEISQTVVSTLELETLLDLILKKLASVIGYSGAALGTLEDDVLTVQAYRGPWRPVELSSVRFSIAQFEEIRPLVTSKQPFPISDLNDHPDIQSEIATALSVPPQVLARFHSWLVVPLVVQETQIGLMVLTHRKADYYNHSAQMMVQIFADYAAIAIQNARLYHQAQSSTILEERNRLARDLHDSVAQTLYSISLYTDATRKALSADKLEVVECHLRELQRSVNKAVADMRLLIFELRPPVLEKEGLVEAIRTRLDAVEARTGLEVYLQVEGEPRLSKAAETEVYRIVQELLSNVLKHAQANWIIVKIKCEQDRVQLSIQDNGRGFESSIAEQRRGLGFQIIHERIQKIGGSLHVDTAPGQGTVARIELDQE
jgi:signal transduction histidine kinase